MQLSLDRCRVGPAITVRRRGRGGLVRVGGDLEQVRGLSQRHGEVALMVGVAGGVRLAQRLREGDGQVVVVDDRVNGGLLCHKCRS